MNEREGRARPDDLRRTLVRIAHEIVEKNPDGRRRRAPGPSSASTPGAPCSPAGSHAGRRAQRLDVPLGDLDISFYRDDLERREPGDAAGRPRLAPRLRRSTAARSSSSTTSSSPAARSGPRSTPSSTTAARSASSSPCSPTAATASCRSAPTTSARTCRPRRDERVYVRLEEIDGLDEVDDRRRRRPAAAQPRGGRDEAPARDRGPRPRRHRADLRPRRELRRGRSPRHQEGADAARPHGRQPLLRVEHPDQLLVRARRQAALRRRGLGQVERLVGGQGRVPEGHDRDPLRLRARRRS